MLALVLGLAGSNPKPSGRLWTPETPFNISAFPSIVRDGPFRILQLTDLHINTPAVCVLNAFAVAEALIESQRPDLIVMTGDSVCDELNGVSADLLVDFIDGFNVPYTFTLGNHDGEGGHDNEDLTHIFASGANSVFDRGPGSVHGFSNSAVNLVDPAGRVVYALVMIDSNPYSEFIYPDQGFWLEWFTNGIRAQQGRPVKTALFYHIPLREMLDVKADMEQNDPSGAAFAFREPVDASAVNASFWRKVKDIGATTHMFFGHDHRNLVNYRWQGVNWVYGLKTGTCSYWDRDRIGGTLITIGQDGQVTVDFVYETDVPPTDRVKDFVAKGKGRSRIRQIRPRQIE
jgi:hypothetical protein